MERLKVAVTGASGHVGYHVARALLTAGYEVHLLVRRENFLTARLVGDGAVVHVADFARPADIVAALRGASGLFHLAAANTTGQGEREMVLASTSGLTERIVDAALEAGVPKIIYTSSVVVLGRSHDPRRLINEDDLTATAESPYVQGKSDAERFCRERARTGADIRIVYPSWVVGPDDPRGTPPHRLIADYVAKGQRFDFAGGISVTHVEDVAAAHVAAFEKGVPQGRYILGGVNVTFADFYRELARDAGRRAPRWHLSKPIMMALATVAKAALGMLGKSAPVDPRYVSAIVGHYSWYDSSRAERELGYRIRPLAASLSEAVTLARQRLAGTDRLNLPADGPAAAPPAPAADGVLLIAGVPGWLGNRLIDILLRGDRFGHRYPTRRVRLLQHPSSRGLLNLPANFETVYADINDRAAVEAALDGVTTVFHLVGTIYPPQVDLLYRVNAEGTRTLVNACIARGVRRILYMSTDSVCGHGTPTQRVFDEHTPARPYKNYGRSKWMAEEYLMEKTRARAIDATVLRGFWFFGPFAPDRQVRFVRSFFWPRQPVFGTGKNLRSISHVDNIVQALFRAEHATNTHGKWYWIGDGDGGSSVDQIYAHIAEALGRPYRPFYIPVFVCRMLDLADWLLSKFGRIHPTIHAAAKFHFDIAGSSAAAGRDFGYEPKVTLRDAAREMKDLLDN